MLPLQLSEAIMKIRFWLFLLTLPLLAVVFGSLPSCGSNPTATAPVTVTQPVTILVTATDTITGTPTPTGTNTWSPTVTFTPTTTWTSTFTSTPTSTWTPVTIIVTPTDTPGPSPTPSAVSNWSTGGTLGFTVSGTQAFVGTYSVSVAVFTLSGSPVTTIGEGVYASGITPDGAGGVFNTGACNGGTYQISNVPDYVGSAPATGCTRGIAYDGTYLYVTDGDGGNYVHKYTVGGSEVTQWAVPGGNPWGIAIGGSPQTIYTASRATSVLYTYDLNGNPLSPSWSLASDGTALAVDANGKVYAAGESGAPAQRFTSTGYLETQWGSFNCYGIAFDGSGNVYVGDSGTIWIFAP